MATFGWAYIDCSDSGSAATGGGQAAGPTGSIQFVTGSNSTSGSLNLMFHTESYGGFPANTLILTGTLAVEGTVSASHFHIEDVAIIDSTGSTYFGNSNDDVHIRTGSMFVGTVEGGSITAFGVDINTNQTKIVGLRGEYSQITSDGQTSSADMYIYGIAQGGNVDFRLHSAATANTGAILIIKDEEIGRSGEITVRPSGSETIDNVATYQLSGTNPAISLYSNGVNWFVF
jgi:hypothetical protein